MAVGRVGCVAADVAGVARRSKSVAMRVAMASAARFVRKMR